VIFGSPGSGSKIGSLTRCDYLATWIYKQICSLYSKKL